MTRLAPALYQELPQEIQKVLDMQARVWGTPLANHLLYARVPSLFRGVRGMWHAIDEANLIESPLQALVNRRVAMWNGCEFWQDINAAVGSKLGVSDEKLLALKDWESSGLFTPRERAALAYADAMTVTGREVSDEQFAELRTVFTDDELVTLTLIIAWENASSKFNRALRVPSQNLWQR